MDGHSVKKNGSTTTTMTTSTLKYDRIDDEELLLNVDG